MNEWKGGIVPLESDKSHAALPSATTYTATPPFDAARYWAYLEDLDGTDEEKAALLEVLWSIMAGFVRLGFGDDRLNNVVPSLAEAAMREEDDSGSRASFNAVAAQEPMKEGPP